MRDGSEGECEESYSIIPFDTSLTCCIALCTVAQYSACSQSFSLSTNHTRKHIDITHASAWLKVACNTARAQNLPSGSEVFEALAQSHCLMNLACG